MSDKVRLRTVLRALDEQRGLEAVYATRQDRRTLLPICVFETADGHYCMSALDSFHDGERRTFRLDRFETLRLGEPRPEHGVRGKTQLWPGAYRLRKCMPQWMSDRAAGKYIAAGWKPAPHALVLRYN